MTIVKEGRSSSYGLCWIEDHGTYYMVFIMDGKSQSGPYSSYSDALNYFRKFCI